MNSVPKVESLNKPLRDAKTLDYVDLRNQINDHKSSFYGPHRCEGCGQYDIVKQALEDGAASWEYPNKVGATLYRPHHCSHVLLFKKLAGAVLTIVDAAFPPASPQLKSIKDLLKRDFAATISKARELEGDRSCESTSSLEQLAEAV
jgi:hypothetical protein